MRKTIAYRWIVVIFCTVAGYLCAQWFGVLYWQKLTWFNIGGTNENLVGYLFAVVLIILLVSWLKPRQGHWSQWRFYPPSALPVLLGSLLFALGEASNFVEIVVLLLPAILLVFAVLVHWYLTADPNELLTMKSVVEENTESDPGARIASLSRDGILAWVKDQSPGRYRARDFVGLSNIVNKLLTVVTSERLGAGYPQLMETCVVVGPFGSGKSTLIEHLCCEAEKERHKHRIIVAVTSCWGFESSEKAQEHILEAAVDRLHDLIDCGAIRRLPRAYGAAFRDTEGWTGAAGKVMANYSEPVVTLKYLSSMLELTGRTLVVVVEDIDRGGSNFDLYQLLAVFHHLRQIPRVSFILTLSTPLPIELGRIAECVHRFRGLRPAYGAAIIRKFSESVRSRDIVYPENLVPTRSSDRETAHYPQGSDWKECTARLAATLRTLKVCLYAVHEEWPALDGEVNLDEFIAFVVLREAAPAAHAFITEHAEELRSLGELPLPTAHKTQDDRATHLREKWNSLVANVEFDVRAAGELLVFLFPGSSRVFSVMVPPHGSGYQALWTDGTYLERMQDGALKSGDRDQPALRFLDAFKRQPEPAEHREALLSEPSLKRIVRFADALGCLSTAEKLRVIGYLLEQERAKGARAAISTDLLLCVSDWLPRNGGDIDEIKSFLLEQIQRSVPHCFPLALDIVTRGGEYPSIAKEFLTKTVAILNKELRKLDGDALAEASPDEAPSIHAMLAEKFGPMTNWKFLAGPTLDAMAQDPEKMTGQLIDAFREEDGSLSMDQIKGFFADRTVEFLQKLAKYHPSRRDNERIRDLRQKAAEEARKMLGMKEFSTRGDSMSN